MDKLQSLLQGGKLELEGITEGPLKGGVCWHFYPVWQQAGEGIQHHRIHHGTQIDISLALEDVVTSVKMYGIAGLEEVK